MLLCYENTKFSENIIFFRKNMEKSLVVTHKSSTFASQIRNEAP